MENQCPICENVYTEPPALSRLDNKTLICPSCGVRQALDAVGVKPDFQEEIVSKIEGFNANENKF